MNRLALLWQSSVGKKAVMGVTGLILVAYLVTHVLAKLHVENRAQAIVQALKRGLVSLEELE